MDNNTDTSSFGSGTVMVLAIALALLMIIATWKVFVKARKPGWASIIPIYSNYVTLKIANRPGWWLVFYFIPFVNVVVHLVVCIDIAKAFGKGGAFGVFGLWLFPFVGYPMLGFGDAKYRAPKR